MLRPPQRRSRECPDCGERLTNVQGIDACPACRWIDRNRATKVPR